MSNLAVSPFTTQEKQRLRFQRWRSQLNPKVGPVYPPDPVARLDVVVEVPLVETPTIFDQPKPSSAPIIETARSMPGLRCLPCGCATVPPDYRRAVLVCARLNILLEMLAIYSGHKDEAGVAQTRRVIEDHLKVG